MENEIPNSSPEEEKQVDEAIKLELKHQSQILNILSYWLKKSVNKSREKVRVYILTTKGYLERVKKRLDMLLRKKML